VGSSLSSEELLMEPSFETWLLFLDVPAIGLLLLLLELPMEQKQYCFHRQLNAEANSIKDSLYLLVQTIVPCAAL